MYNVHIKPINVKSGKKLISRLLTLTLYMILYNSLRTVIVYSYSLQKSYTNNDLIPSGQGSIKFPFPVYDDLSSLLEKNIKQGQVISRLWENLTWEKGNGKEYPLPFDIKFLPMP